MDKPKRREKKQKEEPDRLADAIAKRIRKEVILDKELTIHKWNLRITAELGKSFRRLFGVLISKISLSGAVALQMNLSEIFSDNLDEIVDIVAKTIEEDNFENLDAAKAWVETLGYEAVELLVIIAEMNFRPLVATGARARNLFEDIVGKSPEGAALKALLQQISSPRSSQKDTPTK